MPTRKALFFKVCMDISYPKKTSGILTYFSLNIALTAMRLHLAT
ncbi:hypothetical protein [Helicobacter pylori]|nr:hypothetical protein [Helicobacter pylori]